MAKISIEIHMSDEIKEMIVSYQEQSGEKMVEQAVPLAKKMQFS